MAERKVLNKYYPPDFDPSKLRSFEKKSTRKMCNVRMMLPMTVRCHSCHQYMYIGTKFNMKVETVQDEDYLGIKIYRFYFKCTHCYREITFKTDPKNNDYVAEFGASRNHEPWKDMLLAEEEYKALKRQEMKEDVMKSLEYRTYDSKREMDILDAMDQVKTLNRRENNVDHDELIRRVVHEEDKMKEIEKEENEKAKEKYFEKVKEQKEKIHTNDNSSSNNKSKMLLQKKIERESDDIDNESNNYKDVLQQNKLRKINDIFKLPKLKPMKIIIKKVNNESK